MTVLRPFTREGYIGFIGLGAMGSGMAHCLLDKGYKLQVFARRPPSIQTLIERGAEGVSSAAALGRDCSLVFLSLPDAAAVEKVLFGADGLAEVLAPGSCVIDTSTISAAATRNFGQLLRQRGVWLMDAPVSGGEQGAKAGTLGCMVGGDLGVLAEYREPMSSFCKIITHVGELGAGQTVKACNQVAVAGALLGVADALTLARAEGVDSALMCEVLLGGSARSFSLEKHAPRIIEGRFTPGFRANLMLKDLRLALATAHADSAVLPTTTLAEKLLSALCEGGRHDWDWSALALQVQTESGMTIPEAREPS